MALQFRPGLVSADLVDLSDPPGDLLLEASRGALGDAKRAGRGKNGSRKREADSR